mmetsp:Transcript_4363/g.13203  ORF Transcript_4363/g.13203 Transcript_4363/m.13203 type:complete len:151 (-) Transcript_4363:2205-2657(-)
MGSEAVLVAVVCGALLSLVVLCGRPAAWLILFAVAVVVPGLRTLGAVRAGSDTEKRSWCSYWIAFSLGVMVDKTVGDILRANTFYPVSLLLLALFLTCDEAHLCRRLFEAPLLAFYRENTVLVADIGKEAEKSIRRAVTPLVEDTKRPAT